MAASLGYNSEWRLVDVRQNPERLTLTEIYVNYRTGQTKMLEVYQGYNILYAQQVVTNQGTYMGVPVTSGEQTPSKKKVSDKVKGLISYYYKKR